MTPAKRRLNSGAPEARAPADVQRSAPRADATRLLLQWLPELLLAISAFVGLLFFLNLWWSIPAALRPGGQLGRLLDILTARGFLPWFGALLLVVTTVAAARRLRWRINHTTLFWKDDCPRCGDPDLQRIPRKPHERRIAALGIPVRRYYCVVCRWRGTRIEGTLVHD